MGDTPLVQLLVAAGVVAAAVVAGAMIIAARLPAPGGARVLDAARMRRLQLLSLFSPGIAAAAEDARVLLVWQPLATMARLLFPDDFAELDRAAGATFPFSREQLHAAHARWSAEWLAWERAHDAEYKLKAAAVEEDLRASVGSAAVRARLDSVEREKLDRYQRRYEEYTRVSKGLKGLLERQVH